MFFPPPYPSLDKKKFWGKKTFYRKKRGKKIRMMGFIMYKLFCDEILVSGKLKQMCFFPPCHEFFFHLNDLFIFSESCQSDYIFIFPYLLFSCRHVPSILLLLKRDRSAFIFDRNKTLGYVSLLEDFFYFVFFQRNDFCF